MTSCSVSCGAHTPTECASVGCCSSAKQRLDHFAHDTCQTVIRTTALRTPGQRMFMTAAQLQYRHGSSCTHRTTTSFRAYLAPRHNPMQPSASSGPSGPSSTTPSSSYNWQAAFSTQSDRQTHPAAERNKEPILEVLRRVLPPQGLVLEVASGSGQHVAHFAAALPHLTWQPTDLTDGLFPSIAAHCIGLPNVRPPLVLDASNPDAWPVTCPVAAVLVSNMTHISPWAATQDLIKGAGRLLAPGGVLCIYGPFKLEGAFTSDSNEAFHQQLRASNPEW